MNFDELLRTLQRDYLASLPEKIKKIEEFRLDNAELREAFHKLKGTGKTYGIPEVSELSALMERICLENPLASAQAADAALGLLRAIYEARGIGREFNLKDDPRLAFLQKLLQT